MSEHFPDHPVEVGLRSFFAEDGTTISNRAEFEKHTRRLFRVPGNEEIIEKVCIDHLAQLTDLEDRGMCLRTLGLVFINEDPNRAISYLKQAEQTYAEAGNNIQTAATLHATALAYRNADRLPEALNVVDREAKLFAGWEMELGPTIGDAIESLERRLLEEALDRGMFGLIQLHCHRATEGDIYKRRQAQMLMWQGRIHRSN